MNDINFSRTTEQDVSQAFRSYLLRIYSYMTGGLAITGIVAFLTASSPTMMHAIFGTPLAYVVMFAPLVFMLVISFGINKLQSSTAQLLFWAFAAVMGLSLASIFMVYTGISITRVFLITSATFLVMSIYGYTTKTDLSRFGAILMMGLIGIIIASIVNIFLRSSGLELAVSILGVLIFTGLTAWDTQKIKLMYDVTDNREMSNKKAIIGALTLYLDFINLFLMLLRFIGDRRN
ncbi:Bax inhibitor-1/YccA family protein [Rickettsiales bacterium LUAb2]